MIDLTQIVVAFLHGYLLREQDEIILDHNALAALHTRHMESAERQTEVATWLLHCRAHRIHGVTAEALAETLLALSGTRARLASPLTPPQILAEFDAVCEAFTTRIGPAPPLSAPRNIDCLVSKALWLIYPHDIPIIDRNAETALRVILRLQGHTCDTSGSRYPDFLHAWLIAYHDLKPAFDSVQLSDYPYQPRVFDCFLSWLGQESFPTADDIFALPPAVTHRPKHG